MLHQEMNLNIRYDAPMEIWDKMPNIYAQLNGWLGFGKGDDNGENGIPYWFSYSQNEKHVLASLEPGGLQFTGLMHAGEWFLWVTEIKRVATNELGFRVGEIELGEAD